MLAVSLKIWRCSVSRDHAGRGRRFTRPWSASRTNRRDAMIRHSTTTRERISGRDGSGKSTARPKQIRRVLEADVASTAAAAAAGGRTPETPVSRWQVEHVKMNGIRSAQPSGHSTSQCLLPLVALSRDAPHETGVDARLKFGRSVCLAQGSPSQTLKTPKRPRQDRGARVRTGHPATPLHIQASGPGSISCFG